MFYIVFEFKEMLISLKTKCPIELGFRSKCSILNGQVIDIEKSKSNIADMWLIPLDRVTYNFGLEVNFYTYKGGV